MVAVRPWVLNGSLETTGGLLHFDRARIRPTTLAGTDASSPMKWKGHPAK
jgi:hypothetical protein